MAIIELLRKINEQIYVSNETWTKLVPGIFNYFWMVVVVYSISSPINLFSSLFSTKKSKNEIGLVSYDGNDVTYKQI